MKNLLSSALFLMISLVIHAQQNHKDGFIITNNADTIWGKIDYRTDHINSKQCMFKADGAEGYTTYYPGDIEGYRFTDTGRFYVTRRLPTEKKEQLFFAEFLLNGKLNIYYVYENGFKQYYFENEKAEIVRYEVDVINNLITNENIDYIKQKTIPLYNIVNASISARKSIKLGKMNEEKLIDMARKYHKDICTDETECIEYKYGKKVRYTEIHYHIGGGVAFAHETDQPSHMQNSTGYTVGAKVELTLDRLVYGMFMEIGANYAEFKFKDTAPNIYDDETNTDNILSLNAGIGYNFGHSKIRPNIRGGIFTGSGYGYLHFGPYIGAGLTIPAGFTTFTLNYDFKYSSQILNQTPLFKYITAMHALTLGIRI